MDTKAALEHYTELARQAKALDRLCKDCQHVRNTEKEVALWKCAAPQGDIHFISPISGEPQVKRIWNFCEGERSATSVGCGPDGKWWEAKC